MSQQELWATYSVEDHKQSRTLAADILLFDRLVFPVPERAHFPENSGPPNIPGPVQWTPDPEERARWASVGWDPDSQDKLLLLLKPVVRKVPWDETRRKQWREEQLRHSRAREAAHIVGQHLPNYAFRDTRTVLTRDLPAYVTGVAAVGPMYRSVEDMERELGIRDSAGQTQLPGGALAVVLGWDFITPDPEDEQLSNDELLRETVDFVTGDEDFRRHRREFLDWQQKFLKNGTTDQESIERAVKEMHELLETWKETTSKFKVRTITRHVLRIAPSLVGLTLAIAGIPSGLEAAAGGVFLSAGGIAVDEWFLKSAEKGQPAPTAFVHDLERHFGRK